MRLLKNMVKPLVAFALLTALSFPTLRAADSLAVEQEAKTYDNRYNSVTYRSAAPLAVGCSRVFQRPLPEV